MNFIKHQQNDTQQVLIASNAKSASPSISHCGASFTVKASTAVVDNLGECDYKISYSPRSTCHFMEYGSTCLYYNLHFPPKENYYHDHFPTNIQLQLHKRD